MTPAEFMAEIALPTALEFKAAPRARRLAYLSCIVAFHMKDHLKKVGETGIEVTMRTATGDLFDVVRGVCNGTKHVQTGDGHKVAFTVGDDFDRPPAVCDELECDASELGDLDGGRSIVAGAAHVDLYRACAVVLRAYATAYPRHLAECDLSVL